MARSGRYAPGAPRNRGSRKEEIERRTKTRWAKAKAKKAAKKAQSAAEKAKLEAEQDFVVMTYCHCHIVFMPSEHCFTHEIQPDVA